MNWYYLLTILIVLFIVMRKTKKTITPKQIKNKDWKTRRNHPLKTKKLNRFQEIYNFCNNENVVFLDTETTGLSKEDEVIEIAICDINGDILMNTLVRPNVKISPMAESVHKISNKMLKNAPSWKNVYSDYLYATEGKTILAYNSSYDKRIIQQTCKSHGIVNKKRSWDCLMKTYSEFMGNSTPSGMYKKHKLSVAAYNSDVTISNVELCEHRALYDVGMSVGVFLYMRSIIGEEMKQ